MSKSLVEERMLHNEAVFRRHNEQVQHRMDELRRIAKEDNQLHMVPDDDLPLHFFCECSDENCKQRVQLKPSKYKRIHQDRRKFVIVRGHEVKEIEHVLKQEAGYSIVKKNVKPPEAVSVLLSTPFDAEA